MSKTIFDMGKNLHKYNWNDIYGPNFQNIPVKFPVEDISFGDLNMQVHQSLGISKDMLIVANSQASSVRDFAVVKNIKARHGDFFVGIDYSKEEHRIMMNSVCDELDRVQKISKPK